MIEPTAIAEHLHAEHPTGLLLHGVSRRRTEGVRNYTGKHMPQEDFMRLLDTLQASGTSGSMAEVEAFVRAAHELPPRSFFLTFDDGVLNNREMAAPVLHDRGMHGTFYVVSGFLDGVSLSWVDRVESVVAITSAQTVCPPPPLQGAYSIVGTLERIAFMKEIRSVVKSSPDVDPDGFADAVCMQLGVMSPPLADGLDHKLTDRDVLGLDSEELFTIASRSATHPILARLAPTELEEEIDGSLSTLSRLLGRSIDAFAYPEGFAGSIGPEAVERPRVNGVASGVTTVPGWNTVGTPSLEVHRVCVA